MVMIRDSGSIVGSERSLSCQFLACSPLNLKQKIAWWLFKLSAPIDISFRRNARGGIEEHLLADLTSLMDSVTLSNSEASLLSRLFVRFVQSGEDVCHIFFRCDLAQLVFVDMQCSSLKVKLCWRECSSYLGGLSGTLGIGSFLKNLLQDVRKFLML
ncbi:hypothetical protein Tco_0500016 [Tanacetum coccineum]